MASIKELLAGFRKQRLESQEEEKNLRLARLDVGLLVFPSRPKRIMFGVGVGVYVIACFSEPSSHGRLFDGLTRFLILVITIGAMYLGGYHAKVVALRKLIEKENPVLYEKIKKTTDA